MREFHSIDKVVRLCYEKIELFERMLKDKTEMIEKLEQMLLQKNKGRLTDESRQYKKYNGADCLNNNTKCIIANA